MQDRSAVVIRDMKPGEEGTLVRMARRIFSPMEQLGIFRPKHAVVAEADGEIAGSLFLHVYGKEKKTGYLELAFVAKKFRGRGVGNVLYPAATERLRAMGCDTVTAMVRDDNPASWKLLEKQGFRVASLTDLLRELGVSRGTALWIQTLFCVGCGMNFWIDKPFKERSSLPELFAFLWVNLALFVPGLIRLSPKPEGMLTYLTAFLFTLLAGVLSGGIGCLIAGRKWRFGFVRGGSLITVFQNTMGGIFPMAGRWYPEKPENTPECRRALGIQAAAEWIGMLGLYALGAFLLRDNAFFYRCAAFCSNLLLYRLIPVLPFGHFGGARVWAWNKIVFAILAAAVAVLVLVL